MTDLAAFSLKANRILVTGANTGIGQGIALALARAGAEVVGAGRSSMDETAEKVAAADGTFHGVSCDFGEREQSAQLVDRVWGDFGPLDAVINNAGVIRRSDAVDFSDEDWDDVLEVNLTAPFEIARAFGRKVLGAERPGRIVNIASLLSFQGGIRVSSYAATKHGIAGLTKVLSNEWAGKGINVNAIAPGYIATNNTEALRSDPQRSAEILGRIPAGRWGEASDIGETAVFLCAPAARYVTGTVIPVDGGWMAR